MRGEEASTVESTDRSGNDGWTNEFVRDGYDVDGSESRIHPLGMERRVQLAQAHYEVWHGAWGKGRGMYPIVRRLGALLGRKGAAEQYIAESEYLLERRTEIDPAGAGSRRWWLGLGYFFGWWLLVFVVGIPAILAFFFGIQFLLTTYLGVGSGVARGLGVLLLLVVTGVPLGWLLYWEFAQQPQSADS